MNVPTCKIHQCYMSEVKLPKVKKKPRQTQWLELNPKHDSRIADPVQK